MRMSDNVKFYLFRSSQLPDCFFANIRIAIRICDVTEGYTCFLYSCCGEFPQTSYCFKPDFEVVIPIPCGVKKFLNTNILKRHGLSFLNNR